MVEERDDLITLDSEPIERPAATLPEHVGGARADFIAALGRRVAELLGLIQKLSVEPTAPRLRDDLRRRIHALAAGGRLLRFAKLAAKLTDCEVLLEQNAGKPALEPNDLAELRTSFEQLASIAWSEAAVGDFGTPRPPRATTASEPPRSAISKTTSEPNSTIPETVLVVGLAPLGDAFSSDGFEVERTDNPTVALDLARALAPDVIVVDVDRPGARELCETLTGDPLTELIPVVVVGTFPRPDDAAPLVALGIARALPKPASPTALRAAAREATAAYVRREIQRAPFGDVSLDQLGARLAEELRKGLCDAALAQGRGIRVDFGEGSEVLAALWGAVARIRDICTIRSGGAIRFVPTGPEGALPIAPWLGAPEASGDRRLGKLGETRSRSASLTRKVVVVADDDPAVTWFLAGLLRAEGAIVHEAHDGARAVELAHRVTPDLVVSDILMPELDGFALCRALRRDLALRDVPIILLSWKEDLLQRVRELGADADGYLRKEASAATILKRAREVMGVRERVEVRLAEGGEVRGRLDGLTTRTLLALACTHYADGTVTVRDSTYLYEIDLREGRPVRAMRTAHDGTFERGSEVLGALLGVGAGRFVVAPSDAEIPAELDGTLAEQLLPWIASARAAQRLLSGASLMRIERVDLAVDRIGAYGAATPEPVRSLIAQLSSGSSPKALITTGKTAPRLVEDVLCDAAAHGAVTGILGDGGEDLLSPAVEREVDVLRGARSLRPPLLAPVLDLGPIIHTSTPPPADLVMEVDAEESHAFDVPEEAPREPAQCAPSESKEEAIAASKEVVLPPAPRAPTPLPPKASPPLPSEAEAPARENPIVSLGSLTPPPVLPVPPRVVIPKAPATPIITQTDEPPAVRVRGPSSFLPVAPEKPAPAQPSANDAFKVNRTMWALLAVAGVVFAVGARMARDREAQRGAASAPPSAPTVIAQAPASAAVASDPAPTVAAGSAKAEIPAVGSIKTDPILPQEAPLRPEDKVPPGQGMLEIVAGTSDAISIDGTAVGNGPIVKRALAPRKEPYEIRAKLRGEDRVRFVLVKEGRLTRVRIAPPWSR